MQAIKRKIREDDDVDDATALMINPNIATKGYKTLQQMTDRICENLKDRRENLDPNKANAGCNKYFAKLRLHMHTRPGVCRSMRWFGILLPFFYGNQLC